jgi:hypothetical protein
MTRITLTEEQVRSFSDANGADIVLVGPDGKRLGWVQREIFTDVEVAEAEKRLDSAGPWFTTDQVLAHLRSLAPE